MPIADGTSCPFCGAALREAAQSCPECDLPLLGPGGEHPAPRPRALFDGASLFDEAFADERPGFDPEGGETMAEFERRLATKHRGRTSGKLRCVVVALNQAEAEMLCDMLRGEGVRCMIRSPELQSYGQTSLRCDVMVAEEDLQQARELLRIEQPTALPEQKAPHLFALGLMLGFVLLAAIVALVVALGA